MSNHFDETSSGDRIGRSRTLLSVFASLLASLAACGDAGDAGGAGDERAAAAGEATGSTAQASFGQCARDEVALRSPQATECAVDSNCPCGSYCDLAEHTCKFQCMVPPLTTGEACGAGTQCDDTGRCAGPSTQVPANAVQIATLPASVAVAPAAGGVSQLTAQLRLFSSDSAELARAVATVVQVTASDELEVSCDAAVFGAQCALSSWTFSWDGARHNANKTVWVRSKSTNTDGAGEIRLVVDALGLETAVPTSSAAPGSFDGVYRGIATSPSIANGIPVTVLARGQLLLVRDASQTLAPKGAFVLDYLDVPNELPTARRMTWLQPLGAAPSAGAIIGEVKASGQAIHNAATGELNAGFSLQLAASPAAAWSMQLRRSAGPAAECMVDADCATGSVCVGALQACVPAEAWTPPAAPLANNFEDPRSLSWWNAIAPMLGSGDATPALPAVGAFATTGADLIETLECTTSDTAAAAGRIGVTQLQQLGISRSGDLNCVSGAGAGAPTLAPGPVGLATYRDRQTSNDTSLALLGTCLTDLARAPTSNFGLNFGQNVGQCANLARFVPALRLLSTSELDKRTKATATSSARLRGLTARLLQQWTQLHGFLASTGLAEREYDDAVAASLSEARGELLSLLDVLDAGWAALLDAKVAATVAAAATWAPTDTDPSNDYREAKKPVVYWSFNRTPAPQRDLIRGVDFVASSATANKVSCQIRTDRDLLTGDWNCGGYVASLPTTAPNVAAAGDVTFSMFANDKTAEFPPYAGGTLFQTETLTAVVRPLQSAPNPTIVFLHPTAGGGVEWVAFDWVYNLVNSSFAIVRDTTRMTYTLYLYQPWNTGSTLQVFTQRYYRPVSGRLTSVSPRQIRLAMGLGLGERPNTSNFPGGMDDFAIFDSALSKREVVRFMTARGTDATRRDTWPADMVLTAQPMQELTAPVGASLLEAQVTHLDVVSRLAEHLTYEAPAACNGDAVARADLDAAVARAGRSLRQSFSVEGLAAADPSDRAVKARQLLRAKRSKIVRTLAALHSCEDPYGLDDNEVPLYFGDPVGETEAFFAASDYLLALAQGRANNAVSALTDVRTRWDSARQSKIQEQLNATARAIRVGEQETRFGEQLKRLCGITERTTAQIIQQVKDGTFVVDTCFIDPKPACASQLGTVAIMDADPSCYRGIIGAQLMEMRASYHAQQAAYQSWQAAAANTEAAERQCVLKEMDFYGCSALDRHQLTGVSCPAGFEGTEELTEAFNTSMNELEKEKSWFGSALTVISTVAAIASIPATAGASAPYFIAASGALSTLSPVFQGSAEETRRAYEAALQKRSAEAAIRDCWAQAAQYRRAIASAEQASFEANDRMQVAIIQHQNAVSEAREILLEAPITIERELTRPSIPVAFHYWLPDEMFNYRFLMDSARRYTYMALRATEYDLQQKFFAPGDQVAQPSRAAVLGAWRPATLTQELALLQTATAARKTGGGRPARSFLTLNVGTQLLGLPAGEDISQHLAAYARPVYSTRGEYLGEGVRFSFVPKDGASAPVWRCAERLWRANVGRAADVVGTLDVKLLKRTVFGSRDCGDDSMQVSTLHPEKNLLVAGGEQFSVEEQPRNTVAGIASVDLNIAANNEGFLSNSDFFNGSSTELAGQGLFGDYVLLFLAPSLQAGFSLESVHELYVRFDLLSVDNLPPTLAGFGLFQVAQTFGALPQAHPEGELKLETGTAPIVVD